MKKQKQTVSFALRTIRHRHMVPIVVAFFCVATVFAWWFYVSYAHAQTQVMGYYLWGSDNRFVTGGAAAMVDLTEEDAGQSPRLLDGVMVSDDTAQYWPYAVMIENLPTVRPQKGLSQASVVYETLAEGGATRFMAVYDPSAIIPEIMPVRSARPYYIEWVSEYGALYAHAGGSPKALTVIRENSDIHDLEALSRDAVYFWRDRTLGAPHNLVTSSEKMNYALRDKGLDAKEAVFRPWVFKDDAPLEERGDAGKTVGFNFSYGLSYKVGFAYDRDANIYRRFNADQPHLDKNTGEQIIAKNVIVQLVSEPELAGEKGRLDIYVGGEGKAWIFRDGIALEGMWKKASRTDRTVFYDAEGREIQFNRGSTWIHVIPKTQEVTYQ